MNLPGSSSAARPDSRLQRHPCGDSCPRIALYFSRPQEQLATRRRRLRAAAALPSHRCSPWHRGSPGTLQGQQGAGSWIKPCSGRARAAQIYGRQRVMDERHVERARRAGWERAEHVSLAHSNSCSQELSAAAAPPRHARQKAMDRISALRVTRTRRPGKKMTISRREVAVTLK